MLLHIEAAPQSALQDRLQLPESAYRQVASPYGYCHVFALSMYQAALLFEHFPLDLQPIDGVFPAPGPIARRYHNARIHACSALAAVAFRAAVAHLADDPADQPTSYRITLHNVILPDALLQMALRAHAPHVQLHQQAAQPDMGDIVFATQASLRETLDLALSIVALSDPEAAQWVAPQDLAPFRADAASWLGEHADAYDASALASASRFFNPAYKLLAEDGDPQREADDTIAARNAHSQALGHTTLLQAHLQEVVTATSPARIAFLLPDDLAGLLPLLEAPGEPALTIFHPAVHHLQRFATQLNAIGLTQAQAMRLALLPSTPWLKDPLLADYDLMLWTHGLHTRLPEQLESSLHNLLTAAKPRVLLLTGELGNGLSAQAVDALAARLSEQYPYASSVQQLAADSLILLRLTLRQP